ncbi:hypothetical protein [Acidisoma cellulosilyticum]|nr:hypothetical protein [Acidisoma cellulosilyticum]
MTLLLIVVIILLLAGGGYGYGRGGSAWTLCRRRHRRDNHHLDCSITAWIRVTPA